ncbi:MAG: T9SS type A sorting domain-containing protein, partial [Cytophagales bacterium]|nr:T9SS type A sorting domain-containing protein [Cytophagales bacterium]
VSGATSYVWSLGNASGSSVGTSINVTFPSGAGLSTLTVTPVFACGNGAPSSRSVSINTAPAAPGAITGNTTVCANASSVSYSVVAVPGANSYNWTVPSGSTVASGNGTTNITVNFGTNAGNVNVSAINGCGTTLGTASSITINTAPTGTGVVSGNASPCTGTNGTYTVSGITGATAYFWNLPSGSTGSSITNTINVTFGSTNGSISAIGYNGCGSVTSNAFSITLSPAPAAAGAISGPNTVCGGSTSTYSISPVSGATSYVWSLGNASGSSVGTSINVTFPSGAGLSTLTVTPVFACGNGAPSSRSVTINTAPSAPGAITGNTTVCANASGVSYSVVAVPGVNSYNWTVPSGSTVASGNGTTNITVNFGTNAGNVNVSAINGCGTTLGTASSITINTAPTGTGVVSGNASPCTGTNGTYTVSGITGATAYFWNLPSGSTGSSITNTINVTFGSTNGSISAIGYNGCGSVTSNAFAITLSPAPAAAGAISGANSICAGSTATYSISPVSGAISYNWSLGNASGSSNSTSISATFPSNAGTSTLTVTPVFTCGNGVSSILSVTVNALQTPTVAISASAAQVCSGQSITFSAVGSNLGSSTIGKWFVNGIDQNVSIQTFTYTPNNGDQITALISTTGGCFATSTALSNVIVANVSGTQVPTVGIAILSGNNPTCAVDNITFVATYTGGGTSPSFQWKNGTNDVGFNTTTFGGIGFSNGDQISVVLTSSLSCASPSSVTSNSITLNTIPNGTSPCVAPVITSVTGLDNVINGQQGVTYTVPNIPGATYTWTVPGGAIITSGQGTNSITVDWGSNGGNVTVVTSNNYGSSSTTLTVSMPTSYGNDESNYEVSLFPNPSSGTFSVKLGSGISNNLNVSITDNKGIIVYQNSNSCANLGAELPAGHYVVSIITDNGVKRLPFVKLN